MKKTLPSKVFLLFLFLLFTLISAGQDDTLTVSEPLHPYYFHLRYITDSNSILFDVREFNEFRKSRIKGAVNVPSALDMETLADTLERDRSVFIYCDDNFRGMMAAEILTSRGFSKVYSLEGGLILWKKENMPLDRTNIKRSRK